MTGKEYPLGGLEGGQALEAGPEAHANPPGVFVVQVEDTEPFK